MQEERITRRGDEEGGEEGEGILYESKGIHTLQWYAYLFSPPCAGRTNHNVIPRVMMNAFPFLFTVYQPPLPPFVAVYVCPLSG